MEDKSREHPFIERLVDITGAPPKSGHESRQDFLSRLVREVTGMSDEQWKRLPDTIQQWVVDAAHALNEQSSVPEPSWDLVPDLQKREGNSSGAKTGPKAVGNVAGWRCKEVLIEHGPKTPVDKVLQILESEGFEFKRPSIMAVRAGFLQTIRLLDKHKQLVEDSPFVSQVRTMTKGVINER